MDAAEQSIKNGKQIFSFLKMLGTAGIKDEDEARENLLRTVRDPAKQSMIAKEVEAHRDHFANVRPEIFLPISFPVFRLTRILLSSA